MKIPVDILHSSDFSRLQCRTSEYEVNLRFGRPINPGQPIGMMSSSTGSIVQMLTCIDLFKLHGSLDKFVTKMSSKNDPEDGDEEIDSQIEKAFNAMDVKSCGRLDKPELVNGMQTYNGIKLKSETIVLLAGMYESEKSGGLTLGDFKQLHVTLMGWSHLFREHDVESQEYIVHRSLCSALQELGYKLDRSTTRSLTRKLGRQAKYVQEDAFVRICCILRRLTSSYNAKDVTRERNVQLSYYEVLHMALDSCF